MHKYIFVFITGFILSASLMLALRSISIKYKILNFKGVSLFGGLGLALSMLISLVLASFVFNLCFLKEFILIKVGFIMLAFGILDDMKEMSVINKVFIQSLCAALLIALGIKTDIIYIGLIGNIVVTYLWIIGITNAFNLLDIMDGLASGVALIVSGAFLVIAILNSNLNMGIFIVALCAAILGFIIFNLSARKLYLGNSGSNFLGLLISAIALTLHFAPLERKLALFTPIIILWLPIIDTLLLIILRVKKGMVPYIKSDDHVALKIFALGFSHKKTIVFMFFLCFSFALAGLILSRVNDLIAIGIIFLVLLSTAILFYKLLKIDNEIK